MLHLTCPKCSARLQAPEDKAGKRLACPRCSQRIEVQAPESTVRVCCPGCGRGDRGLVIGIVALGAGLILLLGGGILVVILLLFDPSGNKAPKVIAAANDAWPSLGQPSSCSIMSRMFRL